MGTLKLLVMDVDGTLTDGCIYMGGQGEAMKAFHVRDGYAIAHLLPELDIRPVILTGRHSEIVAQRARELGISLLFQGVQDKLAVLRQLAADLGCTAEEIAYIGDDLNDLDCIRFCGFSACPCDSAPEVLEAVRYVCRTPGGRGAVRELVDLLRRQSVSPGA